MRYLERCTERKSTHIKREIRAEIATVFCCLLIFIFAAPSWAQTETKIVASDGAPRDWLGTGVSISGDTAIVGAPRHDAAGSDAGAVYIIQDTSPGGDWSSFTEKKITASDAAAGVAFGENVSIDGDTAIVGVNSDNDGTGAVYILEDTSVAGDWSSFSETKLTSSDAEVGDQFGKSVWIKGNSVIVGAMHDNMGGIRPGSAYVFLRTGGGWVEVAKLTASDASDLDFFGGSVAIDGDTALVGAFGDDDAGSTTGSAYVFRDTSAGGDWSSFSETKLTASDGAALDSFGFRVSFRGSTAIVGAWGNDASVGDSGRAYIYQDTSAGGDWSSFSETKLIASDAAGGDLFGWSVDIDGNKAIVGAKFNDDVVVGDPGFGDSGSAYIFEDTSAGGDWSSFTETKIIASDAAADDQFGFSVSISGSTGIVGAKLDDDAGDRSGSAYIFRFATVAEALVDIDPDTLNVKSHGRWVTAYITLPEGFDVADIDFSSIKIVALLGNTCVPDYEQPADLSFMPSIGDRDEDFVPDLTVKFDRQLLIENLCIDDVGITIVGDLFSGGSFAGTDVIRIIDRGKP